MHKVEAKYYDKLENDFVRCHLCPVNCKIAPFRQGICLIRSNEGGTLIASEYGNTVAINYDPIEKKPLYHFKPGSQILSVGPNGCNFHCVFCQNWSISQVKTSTRFLSPRDLLHLAGADESIGVAFTYTEPLIWFEYLSDAAGLLRESGFAVVIVSNGYINEAPARELFRQIDAANFDLKSIRPDFYRKICRGKLTDVQRTIQIALEMGVHVELTNLLIPGFNDTNEEIGELVEWVARMNPKIPLHFSRYFPHYKLEAPSTPEERLIFAYRVARERLDYVYVGNISGIGDNGTHCRKCKATLVVRSGYTADIVGMNGERCAHCGEISDIRV
jgi:pyruvate formate lyase activating enzyme